MSANILVIPEDPTFDGYILKPLVHALLEDVGKPNAKVNVCRDPHLGGIGEAMKWVRLEEIIRKYPMVDVFVLCVDRDGEAGREQALRQLEEQATTVLPAARHLLGCAAHQELEAWVLAGVNLPGDWSWPAIRAERDSKEAYFEPLAEMVGVSSGPGGGRKTLAGEATSRLRRILTLAPELADLRNRLSLALM